MWSHCMVGCKDDMFTLGLKCLRHISTALNFFFQSSPRDLNPGNKEASMKEQNFGLEPSVKFVITLMLLFPKEKWGEICFSEKYHTRGWGGRRGGL